MNTLFYNIRLFFSSLRKRDYIFLLFLFSPIFYILFFLIIFNDIEKISQKNNDSFKIEIVNKNISKLNELFFKNNPRISCNLFKGDNIKENSDYKKNKNETFSCYQKLHIEEINLSIFFKVNGLENSINMVSIDINKDFLKEENSIYFIDFLLKNNFNIDNFVYFLNKNIQNNYEGIFYQNHYEIEYKINKNQILIKIK